MNLLTKFYIFLFFLDFSKSSKIYQLVTPVYLGTCGYLFEKSFFFGGKEITWKTKYTVCWNGPMARPKRSVQDKLNLNNFEQINRPKRRVSVGTCLNKKKCWRIFFGLLGQVRNVIPRVVSPGRFCKNNFQKYSLFS
jgi:hypothetical protein